MFGVLVIVLCRDRVADLGFSAGERQVPLVVSSRVLRPLVRVLFLCASGPGALAIGSIAARSKRNAACRFSSVTTMSIKPSRCAGRHLFLGGAGIIWKEGGRGSVPNAALATALHWSCKRMDGSFARPQDRSRPLSDRRRQIRAGMLTAWQPPPEAKRIIIFGDNDPSYAGHAAAYALARRLRSDERVVEVQIPAEVGADWNDVHQSHRLDLAVADHG
jgi:hypothetical protein